MKKFSIVLVTIIFLHQFMLSSCTKTVTHTVTDTVTHTVTDTVIVKDTVITYPITGLWQGTYSSPLNGTAIYEIDFSIFADGTLTYYGTGAGNTQFSAVGSWTLTGTGLSFSVIVNSAGIGYGNAQNGVAVYNPTAGTLTGTLFEPSVSSSATFTMSKVY